MQPDLRGAAPHGFAYLFEKFPSFSQTFCAREVEAMRGQGLQFPVFSIRRPADEPPQDMFSQLGEIVYLPEKYDAALEDRSFRHAARAGLEKLRALWGDEKEKRRIYEALWLGPILKKAGIRHVHVHFAGVGSRTAFWLKRLFDVNYSVTAHANDIFRDEPPERLRQIFEAASVIVTVSDFSVRFLQENYPATRDRFVRVYNGIRTESFPVSTLPPGRQRIVSVGRYIEKKGFPDLVSACAKLRDFDFECLIVGHGPLEESLKAQVAELGLQNNVFITGPKTEGEIKTLLAEAHVFALPCVTGADGAMDNLPTVIMEAMAAALPVVSTNVAAVPEMVIDGETGFVVPEHSPAEVGDQIAHLLDDRDNCRHMGQKGFARCRDLFDVGQTSAELCRVLSAHGAFQNFSLRSS